VGGCGDPVVIFPDDIESRKYIVWSDVSHFISHVLFMLKISLIPSTCVMCGGEL